MCEVISHADFSLEGDKLRVNLPGSYAVLIMSSSTDIGLQVKQILNRINIDGMGKACLDIMAGGNRKAVKMSLASTTPIRKVPVLYFVVDGKIRFQYRKKEGRREIESWLREKFSTHGTSVPQRQSARSRHSNPGPMHMPTMRTEEYRSRRRKRRDFSMAESQDERMQPQRAVGAPVGINAAWRIDQGNE